MQFFLGLLFGTRHYSRVVIVTRSRSGSNLLCSFLESHPRAFVWREIFRRPHYFTPKLTQRLVGGRYLRRFRVVAYKVFYYHRVPEDYWERLISDDRIRIIHLIRTNFLETYVSLKQASASRKWESFDTDSSPSPEHSTIHLNIADMMAFLNQNRNLIESFSERSRGRKNLLTLTFDQLASGEAWQLVSSLLEGDLDPSLYGVARNTRQGSSKLRDRISNLAEVEQALEESQWRYLVSHLQ
ncbi:MAG: hypothetical protein ACREVI_04475 [Steroidobacteraceae bacterium]